MSTIRNTVSALEDKDKVETRHPKAGGPRSDLCAEESLNTRNQLTKLFDL